MSKTILEPLGDRVVIKIVKPEEKTKSGIVLPDSIKEKPQIAEVVAVGDGITSTKVNDKVIYSKYAGAEYKFDGEEFIIIKLADILAIVSEV